MTPNVKQRIRARAPSFGSLLNFGHPLVAELMTSVGFERLLVDTEHGPIDVSTMATMFAMITRYPVAPFVRVHALSEENVKRVLDAGAWGVLAPNARTREEAESLEPPHPEFDEAMRTVLAASKRHGVAAGIHCLKPETVNRRIEEGWLLVGMINDQRFLVNAAKAVRDAVPTDL